MKDNFHRFQKALRTHDKFDDCRSYKPLQYSKLSKLQASNNYNYDFTWESLFIEANN